MPIKSFKDLVVWQRAMQLVKEVYLITQSLPPEELYGLASQMRRCAISIPSNIAEGKEHKTSKEFLRFLYIADGSASELETQLLLCKELFSKINLDRALSLLDEVEKMLNSLMISLRKK